MNDYGIHRPGTQSIASRSQVCTPSQNKLLNTSFGDKVHFKVYRALNLISTICTYKGAYKGRKQQIIPSVANSWNRWLRFDKMASRVQPIVLSKRDVLHNKPSPSAFVLHKKISEFSESATQLHSTTKKNDSAYCKSSSENFDSPGREDNMVIDYCLDLTNAVFYID
jgi:hypothetical protein